MRLADARGHAEERLRVLEAVDARGGDDVRRAVGARAGGEAVRIDAVVDHLDLLARRAVRRFPARVVVADRRDDVGEAVVRARHGRDQAEKKVLCEEKAAKAREEKVLLAQVDSVLGQHHRRAVAELRGDAGDAAERRRGRVRDGHARRADVEHDEEVVEPAQTLGEVEERRDAARAGGVRAGQLAAVGLEAFGEGAPDDARLHRLVA